MIPEDAAEVAPAIEADLGGNGFHRPNRRDEQPAREIEPDPRDEFHGRDAKRRLEVPRESGPAHAGLLRQSRHRMIRRRAIQDCRDRTPEARIAEQRRWSPGPAARLQVTPQQHHETRFHECTGERHCALFRRRDLREHRSEGGGDNRDVRQVFGNRLRQSVQRTVGLVGVGLNRPASDPEDRRSPFRYVQDDHAVADGPET